MSAIHLVCVFEIFCRAGLSCEDPLAQPIEVNLRYQPGVEIGEIWFTGGPPIPRPVLVSRPGTLSVHRQLSFFVPAPNGPDMISVDPETQAATFTSHIPGEAWRNGEGALDAVSSKGQCAPADDTL
jgi:hypothetical protein